MLESSSELRRGSETTQASSECTCTEQISTEIDLQPELHEEEESDLALLLSHDNESVEVNNLEIYIIAYYTTS